MLCLGLLATTPVGSTLPGLILSVMAVQLIVGRAELFPNFITTRRLPTKQLRRLGDRATSSNLVGACTGSPFFVANCF
jgi:hypothetical protein